MTHLAIILVLLSAFLHALKSLLIKTSTDKQIFLWWYSVCGLVFYLPVFLFFVHRESLELSQLFPWCFLSGAIHFFYAIFLTRSYEAGDLSLVYPIMRSSPAVILLGSVFLLGEEVTLQGATGILVVVLGVYLVNMKQVSVSELLKPLCSLFTTKSTGYAFLTMLTVAGYSLVDKVGAQTIHPFLYVYLHVVFAQIFFSAYLLLTKRLSLFRDEWRVNRRCILLNSIIGLGGYALIIITYTFEKVSYVAAFRQLSIVFAVLMGHSILQEENRAIRTAASAIIFAGAFLIATG